ncbi:MAG: hypothetical protein WB816_09555 [Methylocystis sp.]
MLAREIMVSGAASVIVDTELAAISRRAPRGEPRDIFERWRRELEPAGFGLAAQIATFPGDAALILSWGA